MVKLSFPPPQDFQREAGVSSATSGDSVVCMVSCLPDTLPRGQSKAICQCRGDPQGSANLLEHTLSKGNTREVKNYVTTDKRLNGNLGIQLGKSADW